MKHPRAWNRLVPIFLASVACAGAQEFRHWNPADTAKAPRTLSATGLYADMAARRMIPSANFFEVNSALWSDGAAKQRWFILPRGRSIGFRERDDYWDYPDSTVFVKQFSLDTVAGDSSSRILWETRLLILRKEAQDPGAPAKKTDVWYGFSYKWRPDQKEADLVADTGHKAAVRTWPEGRNRPSRMKKWIFPSRDACTFCHRTDAGGGDLHGRSVLGFFTAQLNRPSRAAPDRNQLQDFFARGLLAGSLPDLAKSPKWHAIDSRDPEATAEKRSRAYLAANCSGCHGTRGKQVGAPQGMAFNYDYHTGAPASQLEYHDISWTYGMDEVPPLASSPREKWIWGTYLVTPRFPQKSALLFRQKARNSEPPPGLTAYDSDRNQMPPMGSFEVDTSAMKVIEEWIRGIPTREPSALTGVPSPDGPPVLRGRDLFLPPGLLGRNPPVLRGLDGRVYPLLPAGPGRFAIPASVPAGVYVFQVGRKAFTRSVW